MTDLVTSEDEEDFPAPPLIQSMKKLFLAPNPALEKPKQSKKFRQRERRRTIKIAEKLRVDDESKALQNRLKGLRSQQKSTRSGEMHRKSSAVLDTCGVKVRRGETLEGLARRMGLEGLPTSALINKMSTDPKCLDMLNKFSVEDIRLAVQMFQKP